MANTIIQLKHSTVQGATPVSLANGEISINTRDGKIFYADPTGTIQEFTEFSGPSGLNQEIQFNDSGVLGANSRLTFNKSTGILTVAGGVVVGGVNVAPQIQFSFNQANAAYTRANNSLDANTGGIVTGTITADSFITTGSYGNIQGANLIYANTFIANTGGYVQFADGTKQYTANGSTDLTNYFPSNTDWGSVTTEAYNVFGELAIQSYDCRSDPVTPRGYLKQFDYGYLS